MAVIIKAVEKKSPAYKAGLRGGETLKSINGNIITDVLDYRFYQTDALLKLEVITLKGKNKNLTVKKRENDELGLLFETYLMDEKRRCQNGCIFCFIDQLPKGLRESLYFKDDDSRLSFLFGNYITLTNLTEHEIERIIRMHISPINISVHTTNPELRVKMMKNKNAGKVLPVIKRLNDAGIKINCQLVLCPDYNDGEELKRSLEDLTALENVECIAAVPVGITGHRDGLTKLDSFSAERAGEVISIIDASGDRCIEKYGDRRVYAGDEFYLIAGKEIPDAEYYGDFLQLENGVGLCALFKSEAASALNSSRVKLNRKRKISIATGTAAANLITDIVDNCQKKWHNLECKVYPIKNNFFGGKISVAGLVTATDIIEQLKGIDLGEELLIPSVMLNSDNTMFLDSKTPEELSEELNVKITPVNNDGYEFIDSLLGEM